MTRRATVDLQEAMKHLGYELWMLAETPRRIRAAQRDAAAVATSAYLESMLFHARALSDFFVHTKRGFASDIRRTDFGNVDWQPGPADAVARIRSNAPVIDKLEGARPVGCAVAGRSVVAASAGAEISAAARSVAAAGHVEQ